MGQTVNLVALPSQVRILLPPLESVVVRPWFANLRQPLKTTTNVHHNLNNSVREILDV